MRNHIGKLYVALYILLSAVSHVFINHTTRSVDPIVSLFYTSFFTIVFFTVLNVGRFKYNLTLIKESKLDIVLLNVLNAVIFFVTFFSLRVLNPATFACLFLGAIPFYVFILGIRKSIITQRNKLINILFLLVIFTLMTSLAYYDIENSKSLLLAKYSIVVVFIGGLAGALILNISKKLSFKKVPASLVVSLRFYGLLVLSLLVTIPHREKLLIHPAIILELFVLALTSIALPLFLLQKALKTVDPLYASILITTVPVITYVLQLFTGYYSFSTIKLSLIVLFSLFLISFTYFKGTEKS